MVGRGGLAAEVSVAEGLSRFTYQVTLELSPRAAVWLAAARTRGETPATILEALAQVFPVQAWHGTVAETLRQAALARQGWRAERQARAAAEAAAACAAIEGFGRPPAK